MKRTVRIVHPRIVYHCGRCHSEWPCPTVQARRASGEPDNRPWWQFWVNRHK